MKIDILAIGVHPDDVELSCAGTLLSHIAAGKKVAILDLTRGELGTRGTPEIRTAEANESSRKMGAVLRANLDFADGFFSHDKAHILPIVEMIRFLKPEIVLANAIEDRHPDHGRAAKLTADACFLAGLARIETEWDGKPQNSWRPKALYHYIQDYSIEPDFVVDITAFMDRKMDLVKTFASQFYDPNSKEPNTPISGEGFLENVIAKARIAGRPSGFDFAEGFTVSRSIGVTDLFHLH